MKFLANYVMKGQFQALVVAGIFGILSQFLLPFAILSNAVIALCVLTKRLPDWVFVFVGTVLLVWVSSYFAESRPGIEFPLTLVLMIPVACCAKVLDITESQSLMIIVAVVLALVLAISVQLGTGNAVQWWSDWLRDAVKGLQNVSYEEIVLSGAVNYMNGLVAMMFAFAVIFSVFIGRWLQAGLYKPGGFAEEFTNIRYSFSIVLIMLVIALVTAVINENLFKDFLIIFSIPFFLQGMAVLHYTVKTMGQNDVYLWPPYVLLIFVPHFVIVGMAGVGLVDIFLNFRKPVKKG